MFEMRYPEVHYREPWQEMPVEKSAPYKCDICGEEFWPDEYGVKAFTETGLQQTLCEDCWHDHIRDYALRHSKEFIRSDDEILREFAEEWFNGQPTEDKVRWIMEMYGAHEKPDIELDIEIEFCCNHPLFYDMVEQDEGVERL